MHLETETLRHVAVFGGVYSNHLALRAALDDISRRHVDAICCLGDLGAFGPNPDRVFPLLKEHNVQCIQGNYDHSIGNNLPDCQCGYTDPRDNHFARISYAYTFANTSSANRAWMQNLPAARRIQLGDYRLLLCHGSPRRTNEFLWESTTSRHFLENVAESYEADAILATHTGIKWQRRLKNGRHFVNVGVLGRPENDGTTNVWYTLLAHRPQDESKPQGESSSPGGLGVEYIPVSYDHDRLAHEMRAEHLPEEFIATILTGWWTTCLEVLPGRERRRGRY